MTSTQRDLSVAHVIDMFNGLDLLVTDDGQQIEAKGNELQKLYLRRKGSPDPQQRNAADSWFKHLSWLKDERERAELLKIVWAHFMHLADVTLDAASNAGVKELTPRLHAGLERLALEECKCDSPLARRFVEDYLREHGIYIGKVFVRPGRVEDFAAVSRLGQISLSWSLPTINWDEIEIVREEEIPSPGNRPAEPKTIYP